MQRIDSARRLNAVAALATHHFRTQQSSQQNTIDSAHEAHLAVHDYHGNPLAVAGRQLRVGIHIHHVESKTVLLLSGLEKRERILAKVATVACVKDYAEILERRRGPRPRRLTGERSRFAA